MITVSLLLLIAVMSAAWAVQSAAELIVPDLLWLRRVRLDEAMRETTAAMNAALDALTVLHNREILDAVDAGYGSMRFRAVSA